MKAPKKNTSTKRRLAASFALAASLMMPASRAIAKETPNYSVLRSVKAEDLGVPHFRHHNPVVEGKLYVFRDPLYDTYMVAANTAVTSQRLFTVPEGGNTTYAGVTAYAKTSWDTNMQLNALLPQPQKFYTRSLLCYLFPNVLLADALRFNTDTRVTFNISSRNFYDGFLAFLPGGASLSSASSGVVSNGWPVISPSFETYGDNGETIEQGQSLNVIVNPTLANNATAATATYTTATTANAGLGIMLRVYLDGLKFREVL